MKKILALVLALVMTLSLATISSGAAYSDADKVQYVDAVNTMSALGVMGGYADGSIRPQADVTRGAAAKMVAMVATGSNATTIGYYKGTSSFADVPATHTFADAVAFCVARGIVAGYGDGNYGVADNVKGWAVAKMVLVAMGYDAKAYGMEGAGSALNTITLASSVGLFDGMAADFVATDAASREECAQIVYNALTLNGKKAVPMNSTGAVEYQNSDKCLLDNYNIDGALGAEDAMTALAGNIGMVVENQATGEDYTVIGETSYAVETGKELIGHVVLAVENGVKDAYGVSGVYAVVDLSSEVVVAKAIAKKADFVAAFGVNAPAIDADASDEDVADLAVFHNYATAELDEEFVYADGDTKATSAGTYVIYNGEVVSYLTVESDLVVLDITVDDATKGYYTVALGEDVLVKVAEEADDCEDLIVSAAAIDWMAMDTDKDNAAVALYVGTPCGDKLAIEEVKTVEGKVSLINASTSKVTVNGTVYEFVAGETDAVAALGEGVSEMNGSFADLTNTYKFYLDEAGKIFAASQVTSTSVDTNTYAPAYVVGTKDVLVGVDATYGTESYAYSIQYYTVDGAVNTATYYSLDGDKVVTSVVASSGEVAYADASVSGWVLVAKTANGVAVKSITEDGATGYYVASADDTMAATSTKFDGNFVTKASAFLYSEADELAAANTAATVIVGAHEFSGAAEVVLKDSANTGAKDIVAAWIADEFEGADVDADFVYVVSYEGYLGKDAATEAPLYSYTVIDKNGAMGTATYTVESGAADYEGGWYTLTTNSATGLTTFGEEYDAVEDIYDEALETYTVDGVKYLADADDEYVLASGLKIIDLRAAVATGEATAVSSIAKMLEIEGTYVLYALTTEDQTTHVVTINTLVIVDAD